MIFNSFYFAFYLIAAVTIHYLLPAKWRWFWLLVASSLFCAFHSILSLITIYLVTMIIFFSGLVIEKAKTTLLKKNVLLISIILLLSVLIYFKLQENINANIVMPLGISFYTFSLLAYLIDVYRSSDLVEKNIGKFMLFSIYFPKLNAGPIERFKHLLPQFDEYVSLNDKYLIEGLQLILWGFFKKMVVADRLAIFVDRVYKNIELSSPITLMTATFFFSFQIYCDFSGYSDIAIGSARLFGFKFGENFNRPYFAANISDFWRRWHISLSNWLREYLFLPIAFYFSKKTRNLFSNVNKSDVLSYLMGMMLTMSICGLWHKIRFNFILWGAVHGVFLSLYFILKRMKLIRISFLSRKIKKCINSLIVFFIVGISWIIFRAESLGDIQLIFSSFHKGSWTKLNIGSQTQFVLGIIGIITLLFIEILQGENTFLNFLKSKSRIFRWSFYLSTSLLILLIGVLDGGQFIYANF